MSRHTARKPVPILPSDLRGFQRLANEATVGLTDVVEAMHRTIARPPVLFGPSPDGRTAGITGLVYRSVRGVTRIVGASLDALLGALAPLGAERPSSKQRDAVLAALNGVLGDYLAATGNPLALRMELRHAGRSVPLGRPALAASFPDARRRLLVLVHGLCMNDRQWAREGHDHGRELARALDCTPLYLRYNSGLHVSTNGRALADLMEALVAAWPVPVESVTMLAHSMGGLVARSACHYAEIANRRWRERLDAIVFLGTPHLGAPGERAGAWADYVIALSPYTAPFARLGGIRSAGIKDLRHGSVRDEDWQAPPLPGHPTLPLPRGVRCYAIAASRQPRPAARVRGDGLVPVASALGRHRDPARDLALPAHRQWIGFGMGHFDLLARLEVCARIADWLAEAPERRRGRRRSEG
ncbi:MAG: alpha/beta hydrolase [Burkholderiales bacterium]